MERLAFTSAEELESYCEHLRGQLNSRTDEQRQLIETALARLDQLATQAQAVHSGTLAAEIAARREEGLQMLARLGKFAAPPANGSAPVEAPEIALAPETPAAAPEAPAPLEAPVEQLSEAVEPPAAAFAAEEEAPVEQESVAKAGLEAPIVQEAVEAPISQESSKIEAFWQQPVDARPEPEAAAFQAPEAASNDTGSLAAEPVAEVKAEENLSFGTFGAPIAGPPVAPIPHFHAADVPTAAPPAAEFGAVEVTPPAPDAAPAAAAGELPPALNWAWGTESASPAWAALLVDDAPVPMEPLSDSHFIHAPPPSEVAAGAPGAPGAEAPPIAASTPDGAAALQQLVLNVKVGDWGSKHPLSKEELLIGRRDMATRCKPDVEVMYDQAVSRRHLRIVRDNGHYVVEDLNSTNGTTLNGRSLRPGEPEALKAGDELEIGEFTLLQIAAA